MQIRELMSRYVEVIAYDTDVRSAAAKMRDLNVNVIPVCDGARFVGILTDRDIAVRLAAEGRDAIRTRVSEVMTRDLTYCYEDQTIEDAGIVMEFHQISRLPILSRAHDLVGIVSASDITTTTRGARQTAFGAAVGATPELTATAVSPPKISTVVPR
jgi:CBS domain-containing protein